MPRFAAGELPFLFGGFTIFVNLELRCSHWTLSEMSKRSRVRLYFRPSTILRLTTSLCGLFD